MDAVALGTSTGIIPVTYALNNVTRLDTGLFRRTPGDHFEDEGSVTTDEPCRSSHRWAQGAYFHAENCLVPGRHRGRITNPELRQHNAESSSDCCFAS